MKLKIFRILTPLFLLAGFILGIYTLLVKPRRFFQCLSAPVYFFAGEEGQDQQAALPEPVSGNHVELLVNGDEALPAMLDMISGARETIRWQVMLFTPDQAGRILAGALEDAARRGVQVQLSFNIEQTVNGTIADGYSREQKKSNQREMKNMLDRLRAAGVEVRANPAGVDFPLDQVDEPARQILEKIQDHVCVSANHYDHRKLLIADGRRALVGGMNVGNHYQYRIAPDIRQDMVAEALQRQLAGLPEAWEKWLDVLFIIEGPVVSELVAEFNWKWDVLGGQASSSTTIDPLPNGVPVQFLRQRPGTPQAGAGFFELVSGARKEIYVASPFVSYEPALMALAEASQRGVRVIFVYPDARQEIPLSRRIFHQSARSLVESGVELYFNDLRMAHTKLMVVDSRQVLFGSFNLNHRSFRHDLEVAAIVEDESLAREVIQNVFQPYLTISHQIRDLPDLPWDPINWLLRPFS